MGRDHPGIYVPPPLLYAIPFGLGIVLHRTVGGDAFPEAWTAPARAAGVAFLAAAVTLALTAEAKFLRAGTSPLPMRPATALLKDGPYRFTRNPMYVALAVFYAGATLVVGYAWPFAFLPVALLAVDRYVIPREERYLDRTFGAPYRQYRESVRRWL